jgi:hypothetical protein
VSRADDNQVDMITINSYEERDSDVKQPSSSILDGTTTIHQHELLSNDAYESDNDWEMARAVQLSMNDDSIQHRHQKQPNSNPFEQSQHQQINDIEAIASLPNEARYQWIDSQWKAQRIQSRRECIQAAANPEDYSNVQLRNFYKSNALAKRVGEISKLVETRKDEFQGGGGGGDDDGDEGGSVHRARPSLQRLRRHNQENSSTDDDNDDNEMFGSSTNYAGKMILTMITKLLVGRGAVIALKRVAFFSHLPVLASVLRYERSLKLKYYLTIVIVMIIPNIVMEVLCLRMICSTPLWVRNVQPTNIASLLIMVPVLQ